MGQRQGGGRGKDAALNCYIQNAPGRKEQQDQSQPGLKAGASREGHRSVQEGGLDTERIPGFLFPSSMHLFQLHMLPKAIAQCEHTWKASALRIAN